MGESLYSVLKSKYNYTPEQSEKVVNYLHEEINKGADVVGLLTSIFGTDIDDLLEVLGGELK